MIFIRPLFPRRVVALLLIALTCLCLGVEDLLMPGMCAEDGSTTLADQRSLTLVAVENTDRNSQSDTGEASHDCLCCCRHLLTSRLFQPVQSLKSSILPSMPAEVASSITPRPPYHPPRS